VRTTNGIPTNRAPARCRRVYATRCRAARATHRPSVRSVDVASVIPVTRVTRTVRRPARRGCAFRATDNARAPRRSRSGNDVDQRGEDRAPKLSRYAPARCAKRGREKPAGVMPLSVKTSAPAEQREIATIIIVMPCESTPGIILRSKPDRRCPVGKEALCRRIPAAKLAMVVRSLRGNDVPQCPNRRQPRRYPTCRRGAALAACREIEIGFAAPRYVFGDVRIDPATAARRDADRRHDDW